MFFLLFPNFVLSHPLGINGNKVDINFKCTDEKNIDREINFGFKEYNFQKDGSKVLLSVPFNKKSNKYGVPTSGVYEFGTYKINNEVYDNMQAWFDHGYLGSNIYVFRRALVKQNNTYLLNDSLFNSTKLIHNKLDKLQVRIIAQSNKDYEKTANLIKKYGNLAFGYIVTNAEKTFFANIKFKCTLE